MPTDNDYYVFASENSEEDKENLSWQGLIIDDDKFYQRIKESFKEVLFEGRKITLLNAYTLLQAQEILQHTELDLIIINVDLLNSDSALELLKCFHQKAKKNHFRIILTGKSCQDVININLIKQYHIDSWFDKEAEKNTIYLSLLSSLRHLHSIRQLLTARQEVKKIVEMSTRFVPASFLKMLNKSKITDIQLTDHIKQEMTVLFLDIRSFTTLSEFLTPEETFQFINNFLSYLQPLIASNEGFIDKFIGDAIMALFPQTADNAVKAAIGMIEALEKYNYSRMAKYEAPIKIGIGINSGNLIMGIVGFYDRLEFTVISDTVNTASRIEKLTKKIGASILISENTLKSLKDPNQFHYRDLSKIEIVGKHEFIKIYEIFDADPPAVIHLKQQTCDDFKQAVTLYENYDYSQARSRFEKILNINPHDRPAKYFLEKIESSIR